MNVKISKGNSKIGKIWNVSTTPVASCPKGVPCAKSCYALKAYRQYPATKSAWGANFECKIADIGGFYASIHSQLASAKKLPKLFRFHVAGDFISSADFLHAADLARAFPTVKFLAFTKHYGAVNGNVDIIPANFSVVFSAWPSLPMDNPHNMPVAYYQDGSVDVGDAIECHGKCDTCGLCWSLASIGRNVYFDAH